MCVNAFFSSVNSVIRVLHRGILMGKIGWYTDIPGVANAEKCGMIKETPYRCTNCQKMRHD